MKYLSTIILFSPKTEMNINLTLIETMNLQEIIHFLSFEDDVLIRNTLPISKPEQIRSELVIRYNKITGSNIPLSELI